MEKGEKDRAGAKFEGILLHPLTLSFTGSQESLEKRFIEENFNVILPIVRIILPLALLFYAIFGILDAYLIPEKKYLFWLIRYAFICPLILGMFFGTFHKDFKKIAQPSIAAIEIIAGIGIVLMIVLSRPPVAYSYYAGLILIIIFGYTSTTLRFVWASLAGWILVLLYETASLFIADTPTPVLINNNFFFISANLIGMLACYLIEFHSRRDFYRKHLLAIERDKVQQAKTHLEERVRERTRQLREINQQLLQEIRERGRLEKERARIQGQLARHQKMESLGLMAGGVAHDLNKILSGIITYPELMLMKLPVKSDLRKYAEAIRDSGNRAAAVVADLLTVARGVASERDVVCINELVESHLASPEFKGLVSRYPEIKLSFNPADGLPACEVSTVHIQKALMNLINNAFEAIASEGRVTLTTGTCFIEEKDGPPGTELLAPGRYVTLDVEDTGHGISPEDASHIFEPFYSKKVLGRSGTGLGLAVVWNTIHEHGGTVTVQSGEGRGTRFTVYLPASRENKSREKMRDTPDLRGAGKILIVDDEPLQRDINGQILSHLGYEVAAVDSGERALEYLRDHAVDLVLLDMVMDPGMDGLQTYREIIKIRPGQKTILVSGYSESDKVKIALQSGVARFIKKPFSIQILGMAVKEVLETSPA